MEKRTPHVFTIKLELIDQHSCAYMGVKLNGNQAGGREKEGRDELTPNGYSVHYLVVGTL